MKSYENDPHFAEIGTLTQENVRLNIENARARKALKLIAEGVERQLDDGTTEVVDDAAEIARATLTKGESL